MALKLGALPPVPSKPRLKLGPHLTASAPTSVDWLSNVTDWPMYANDQFGDCVFAMIGHQIEAITTYGEGATERVSEQDVLKGYSDVTGFDPDDPSTDQGTVVQDALNYWRKTGIGGHKIVAFAEVDVSNRTEMETALALFGTLAVAIDFPASAMDQFNTNQAWHVVTNDGGNEGGHAIHLGAYTSDMRTITTWGETQRMTVGFWNKYGTEAWAVISNEWVNKAGTTPTGLDLYGLGREFATLTGGSNPFPVPTTQTPEELFIAALKIWLSHRHTSAVNAAFVEACKAWLRART